MKCTKCNHILPDDSEFCQYCGNRIEKKTVMPEVDIAVVKPQADTAAVKPQADTAVIMPEVTAAVVTVEVEAAREALASRAAVAPVGAAAPKQPAQKVNPPEADPGNTEQDAPEKVPREKKVKQPKRKYCSRCGARIDPQTKQCTGCGKKYFKGIRINKAAVAITLLSLVLAASIGLNAWQYLDSSRINKELRIGRLKVENVEMDNEILKRNNEDLNSQVSELKTQNHELRLTMSGSDQALERVRADLEEYEPLVEFCKDYVEIIPNDGTNYYHKFSCNHLDMSNGFLVLNTEAAVGRGFTECPYCRYTQH